MFMAKAYSDDLRLRAIRLIEKKETKTRVSELLGITIQTLCKWWKLYRFSNILTPKIPIFERKKKVDYEELKRYVESNPDKTLKDIGKRFDISAFGVCKILKKINFTYKKKVFVRGEGRRVKN